MLRLRPPAAVFCRCAAAEQGCFSLIFSPYAAPRFAFGSRKGCWAAVSSTSYVSAPLLLCRPPPPDPLLSDGSASRFAARLRRALAPLYPGKVFKYLFYPVPVFTAFEFCSQLLCGLCLLQGRNAPFGASIRRKANAYFYPKLKFFRLSVSFIAL
jgi:hypothetical protein